MINLIDGIIEINAGYFFKFENEGEIKFRIITGYVYRFATECIYARLLKHSEIEKLEDLPKEKKEKYWNLVNKFCPNETPENKIIASRSAYITEIITSTY